ncbi:MAG: HAD family hydrolase [Pseudomonadota bacterium]
MADTLPSWRDTPTRAALLEFVEAVGEEGSAEFVAPADRVAVFDNDGTLWAEKPVYFQFYFVLDRIRSLAGAHPEWQQEQPFKAAIAGDLKGVAATGMDGLLKLVQASHGGSTMEAFEAQAGEWLAQARHPETGRLFTDMVYQPMLELLDFLRANGFTIYIVSGGGIDFLRQFSERVYGIPRERVVGSSVALQYRSDGGQPRIERLAKLDFIDDKEGKPVGIQRHIGRRPILAFGNSDGDYQMLEWTTSGSGRRLGALLHHTDSKREWAYDHDSAVGRLDRGLNEAAERGWLLVDMKRDWARVFPAP